MNDVHLHIRGGPRRRIERFVRAESGAVTVDWVVLTAAIVGLGIAAGFTVSSNVPALADKISDVVESQTVLPD